MTREMLHALLSTDFIVSEMSISRVYLGHWLLDGTLIHRLLEGTMVHRKSLHAFDSVDVDGGHYYCSWSVLVLRCLQKASKR